MASGDTIFDDPGVVKPEPINTDSHAVNLGDQTKNAMQSESSEPDKQPHLGGGHISLKDVEPVDVQIRDLAVHVDTSSSSIFRRRKSDEQDTIKALIYSVSASLKPGTLTAILGGSGSGKTTLLNTLAERVSSSKLTKSGTVTFNGNAGVTSVRHAYVMQQDILLPTLTVRETLQYSAALRLPPETPPEDRQRVVEEVILELGLKECADTRVGNSQYRGCSGGEKRRVSLGVQLLANPSVLFLDEPTTGLDATSAYMLVRTLKNLAAKGRTIITTIHQPRSEIWDLFDSLILVSRGSPVYAGSREQCIPWFTNLGFPLPPFVNPAEFVIDNAVVDNRTAQLEEESGERVARLKEAWNKESLQRYPSDGSSSTVVKTAVRTDGRHATFLQQLRILTLRTLKVTYRDPMGMSASFSEAILLGIATGYAFHTLGRDQTGIRSREGALYTASAMQGFIILVFETYRMTQDIPTYDRERSEGCASPLPFILSRRLARLVTEDIAVPLIYSTIFYFLAGFDSDAAKFFTYLGICIVNHYLAVMFAMVSVSAIRGFTGATLIGNMVYTLQTLAGGFFIQSNTIPIYVRWLKYLTYSWYIIGALCANEFQGAFYDCPSSSDPSDPACMAYTGKFILDSLGFPENWIWPPILVGVMFVLSFGAMSWALLTFKKEEMTVARPRAVTTDLSTGKEVIRARTRDEVRMIDVRLDNFALSVDKRSGLKQQKSTKTILNPITANFDAGVLNVIMGPSGSGKTSLLNAIALRLKNSLGSTYRSSGKLLFNGAEPSESVIRSVVSYVTQEDDSLLPSLTVLETLRFAAGLRLPSWMTKEEKDKRADEVLLKMGLKDCANSLVGNEWIKGISGGEKRRVTIAVQILTDPKILILDEPTSGLDSFMASSLLQVLHGLVMEGRTLILTIHQTPSDLFSRFGNVLLLARGGRPVYSGPARDMLTYLGSRGHSCPQNTNPADFALDVITVDLQSHEREVETGQKVQALVDAWSSEAKGETGLDRSVATPAELGTMARTRTPFHQAFPILLSRATLNLRRQPNLIAGRIMQVFGLGVINLLFFCPLRTDYVYIQTYLGFVQQLCALYFIGMLQNVAVYPAERDVFYREDDDGIYSPEAFLAVYTLLEVPFEIISALLLSILFDLGVGLPRNAVMFFVLAFQSFGVLNSGESIGIMFNTFFNHTGFAVNATSWVLSIANMMAGVVAVQMPRLYTSFNLLSPTRHAIHAVAQFALRDLVFTCDDSQRLPNGDCIISKGEQVLELYNMNEDGVTSVWAMAIIVLSNRLLAWALLRIIRTTWKTVDKKRT
jgi:ABC-type multidrug transport system ATPase subunit